MSLLQVSRFRDRLASSGLILILKQSFRHLVELNSFPSSLRAQNSETFMPRSGFETTIPEFVRSKTVLTLDRTSIGVLRYTLGLRTERLNTIYFSRRVSRSNNSVYAMLFVCQMSVSEVKNNVIVCYAICGQGK
jgi:hypothetical protein